LSCSVEGNVAADVVLWDGCWEMVVLVKHFLLSPLLSSIRYRRTVRVLNLEDRWRRSLVVPQGLIDGGYRPREC